MAIAGLTAWYAAVAPGEAEAMEARKTEDVMYEAAVKTGLAYDKPEKRSQATDDAEATGDNADEPAAGDSAADDSEE